MSLYINNKRVQISAGGGGAAERVLLGDNQVWPDSGSGAYVADWSNGWGSEWSLVKTSSGGSLSTSNSEGLVTAPSNQEHSYALLDLTFDDFEMLVGFGTGGGGTVQGRVLFRWDGTVGVRPTDAYIYIARRNGETARMYRTIDGYEIRLDKGYGATITSAPYWMRLRAVNSQINVKTWRKNGAEPESWNATFVDSSHSSGMVGLGSLQAGFGSGTEVFTDLEITPL